MLGDVPALAADVAEGFDTYREFAPSGWEPPASDLEEGYLLAALGRDDVWCLVAEDRGEVAGHVAFMDATRHRWPDEPGVAHFWQLFVRRPWWGTGLATELHAAAIAEATARGFASMRLYTPAGQARARRFYEREGWAGSEPFDDPAFGMPLIEYRRRL